MVATVENAAGARNGRNAHPGRGADLPGVRPGRGLRGGVQGSENHRRQRGRASGPRGQVSRLRQAARQAGRRLLWQTDVVGRPQILRAGSEAVPGQQVHPESALRGGQARARPAGRDDKARPGRRSLQTRSGRHAQAADHRHGGPLRLGQRSHRPGRRAGTGRLRRDGQERFLQLFVRDSGLHRRPGRREGKPGPVGAAGRGRA